VRSTLSRLDAAGKRAGIRPPAVFVIGPTVELAGRLDWFAQRPLAGQRLLVPAGSGSFEEVLDCAGAEVVRVPLPPGPAAQVVLAALPLTGCVLVDPDQVDALDEQRDGPGWGTGLVCWCMNEATAAHARRRGWPRVERVEDPGDGALLVAAIAAGPHAGV
jgi:uroporphyrinogen-III synthase